jgi:hypothetical protein
MNNKHQQTKHTTWIWASRLINNKTIPHKHITLLSTTWLGLLLTCLLQTRSPIMSEALIRISPSQYYSKISGTSRICRPMRSVGRSFFKKREPSYQPNPRTRLQSRQNQLFANHGKNCLLKNVPF